MTAITLPATTRAGTPCAATWDKKWIAQVDDREARLGRRICGARTVGCTPCLIASDHDSGRCRHHGGFALTGAPEGNRNAEMHGLYSRRLMICGRHCPAWNTCPLGGGSSTFSTESSGSRIEIREPEAVEPKETEIFRSRMEIRERGDLGTRVGGQAAGGVGMPPKRTVIRGVVFHGPESDDPEAVEHGGDESESHGRDACASPTPPLSKTLSYGQYIERLPESERPLCAFEQSEYDGVIRDYEERAGRAPALHLVHHVALLTVMVSRASRALAMRPLTEKVEQSTDDYHVAKEKPTAQLAAFERLSRELRQWVRLVNQLRAAPTPDGGDDAGKRRTGFDEGAWKLIGTQQALLADLYRRTEKVEPKEAEILRSRMEIRERGIRERGIRERGGVGRRDGNDGKHGKNRMRMRWGWPARAGPGGESVDFRDRGNDTWRGVPGLGLKFGFR